MTSTHRWLADEATRAGILIVADQPRTDRPHARGENEYTSVPILISNGPSPRTWGERSWLPRHNVSWHTGPSPRTWGERSYAGPSDCTRSRTIPTHVGRTRLARAGRRDLKDPDHPHARGENADASSDSAVPARTIPTHVGRTRLETTLDGAADHPHARGENFGQRHHGPSCADHPHARGENSVAVRRAIRRSDHPHARGENSARAGSLGRAGRTIPTHVGRTGRRRTAPAAQQRTIPTHVGRTRVTVTIRDRSIADHPHARGENLATLDDAVAHARARTIPTHVGRTVAQLPGRGPDRGPSPRTWGEPERAGLCERSGVGPSPRTWGELS